LRFSLSSSSTSRFLCFSSFLLLLPMFSLLLGVERA
jgi:hypothetical protein